MKHIQLFEDFDNKEILYNTIKISYEGNPDSLFLIYYTGYDDFLSHDIIDIVESEKDGIKRFEEDAKTNSILNGGNIYNWKEILQMYKPYDKILTDKDNIEMWIKKENKMLNPFGFTVERA